MISVLSKLFMGGAVPPILLMYPLIYIHGQTSPTVPLLYHGKFHLEMPFLSPYLPLSDI